MMLQHTGATNAEKSLTSGLLPTIIGIDPAETGDTMPLSGREMLKLFQKAGWIILRTKGSHVIVGRGNDRETIPMHRELKRGLEAYLLKRIGED